MISVDFFCFKLPIIEDPEEIIVIGERCKFWDVGGICMRTRFENGGWSSLQERLDNFVAKDSGGGNGRPLCRPDLIKVKAASKDQIAGWVQGHIWLEHKNAQR